MIELDQEENDDVVLLEFHPQNNLPNNEQITDRKAPTSMIAQDTGERECPICLDPFTKEGPHRIVSTKCGHLFGKSCLLRALGMKNECPTCRKRVRRNDLIELFDCNIVAVDNSLVSKLQEEVLQERNKRIKVFLLLDMNF
jgi:endogenous inhibitor of DNA gyrase (YacG/DUF329 family)